MPVIRRILLVCLMVLLATSVTSADAASSLAAPELRLKSHRFDPQQGLPPMPASVRLAQEPTSGHFIVQFARDVDRALLDDLRTLGVRPVHYMPDQAYVIAVPEGKAQEIRARSSVRWLGAVQPAWKIAPDLGVRPYQDPSRREGGLLLATIDLFPESDLETVARQLTVSGVEVLQTESFSDTRRLRVRADLDRLQLAARIDAVSWIEEAAEITSRNNTTRWVIQSNVPGVETIWNRGLHGEGQIVGHIDGRLDIDSCFFRDVQNNTPRPDHRKIVAYRSTNGFGADSHGTHTAGTMIGNQTPLNLTTDGNGIAFEAKLSHSNLGDITGFGNSTSNLYSYLSSAHSDGARVHGNSWGDDGTTAYTTWARDIDRFSYDFEDSLIVFAATNGSFLRTPENAKNVLAAGASQNGLSANSFCSGGQGPTSDGRRKPELFAPGCSIFSARSSLSCSTISSSGTSMACPSITGAGALVRQYFEEGWYPAGVAEPADSLNPSGALVKAMLLNSATDMANLSTAPPNNREGWGRLLLEDVLYFAGETRKLAVLDDVRNADGLTTGEEATYTLTVDGSDETLEFTLVFTEPPAALGASSATINNLDLEVTSPSGTLYRGNVFSGAFSATGGAADSINNVEMVRIDAPEQGDWDIVVKGAQINQDTQGFALIGTGQAAIGGATLRYSSHTIQDDPPLGNGDGFADPGETITLPVTLRNLLGTDATGVVTQLDNDDPAAARVTLSNATYPDLPDGASMASLAPHHRLTIAPDAGCGGSIPMRILTSSGQGGSESTFGIPLGRGDTVFSSTGPAESIPQLGTIFQPLIISEPLTIADVNVSVQISHTDVSELVVKLRSAEGSVVTLHDRSTGSLQTTFDEQRAPDGPGAMSDFDGESVQGTWFLQISDAVTSIEPAGTLLGWTVHLDAAEGPGLCTPLACPGDPIPQPVSSLFVNIESGNDLRFDWNDLADAAGYRVFRSLTPDFQAPEMIGDAAGDTLLLPDFSPEPSLEFFQVRATNSCNWEGP